MRIDIARTTFPPRPAPAEAPVTPKPSPCGARRCTWSPEGTHPAMQPEQHACQQRPRDPPNRTGNAVSLMGTATAGLWSPCGHSTSVVTRHRVSLASVSSWRGGACARAVADRGRVVQAVPSCASRSGSQAGTHATPTGACSLGAHDGRLPEGLWRRPRDELLAAMVGELDVSSAARPCR